MTNFYHYRQALKEKGMALLSSIDDGEKLREYWGFTNRQNALLDHSATVTRYADGESFLADFTGAQ